MNELRERHDALPEPSPESVAKARARLIAHMAEPAARPRRARALPRWGFGLAGAAAVAVLAVGVLRPMTATEPPNQQPGASSSRTQELRLRTVASAQDLADNAAALAAAEDDPAPSPHQWAYVKSRNVQTRVDGGEWLTGSPKTTSVHEMWRRADDRRWAAMEDGKLKTYDESEFEVSYPFLLSLPTDPGALLDRIYEAVAEEGEGRPDAPAPSAAAGPAPSNDYRHTRAFQLIAQGMRDAALPARLRAAMYGAMARIPGVEYEDRASDLAGRKGVTLYRIHQGYLRDEIFIDPKSYAYLGYRTIVVRDHDERYDEAKKGEIRNWDALLEATVVDKVGRRS
ncbi:CU044_5270 family protein [Nonomuraea purpurea]|uniref:CU044_5270 family protein n=1 Tax=Nonomuraea purpurea TaxID=1849276 RepID=A0ABV8GR97_9ACTN